MVVTRSFIKGHSFPITLDLVKLSYSAQKLLLRAYTVFCFDFQSSVNTWLYKLGCKCMTAQLKDTSTAKRPNVDKTKNPQL